MRPEVKVFQYKTPFVARREAMFSRWMFVGIFVVFSAGVAPSGAREGTIAQAPSKRTRAKEQKAAGDRFMKSGKRKQAEAAYRKACEVDPEWYEAHEALGNLLFSSKRYMEAVEAFKQAIKAEPRYATGFYNIAFAYRKARKYPQAAEYYRKYIQRKQDDPDAYYGLAATYEAMGKDREAMENYLKYAEKETRPSERQYVVKAKNKAEKLREKLGLGVKPKPEAVAVEKPATTTATTTATATATTTATATATTTASRPAARPAARPATKPAPARPATKPAPARPATKPAPAPRPAPAPKPVVDPGAKIARLLAEGDRAMAEKSYTRAMKAYFDAVKLDSRNTDALYKLGLVYQATGSTKAARVKWRNVLEIDPNHKQARQALAMLEKPPPTSRTAVAPAPAPRPTPKPAPKPVAKPAPKPAVKPAPRVAAAKRPSTGERVARLVKEGDTHFKQKSFSRAIAAYTHATQLDPRNEEALFKLGVAYAMSGNYKVAVYKWKQVLRINPKNTSARRNIERAEQKLGIAGAKKPEAAAPEPSRSGRPAVAAKDDFEALMALARQYKRKGKAKKVLQTVNKALKVKQDAQALMLKGEALVVLRRYGEAKRAFSKTMVMDPNLAGPFYGLGEACRLSGDKQRARYYFQMYVKSNAPDVRPALVNRAKAFLKK
jgi:tetratricopeptide (TPR) repeat protein